MAGRWARWTAFGSGVLLLFWICALIGSWSPGAAYLSVNVNGGSLASYSVDTPSWLAPLSSQVIGDASKDQATGGSLRPPSGSPRPTASGGPTSSPSSPSSTLPVPIPTLPTATPTLPPTPSVPVATPTVLPTSPLH